MSIEIDHFPEPKLQFGHYFEHEDTKTGLAEYGPFGKNIAGLHPSEVKLGFVGTRDTMSGAREWVERCKQPIDSENLKRGRAKSSLSNGALFGEELDAVPENVRLKKILNRDFVGFNQDTPFGSSFTTNTRWERFIPTRELEGILAIDDKQKRILELLDLFETEIRSLATTAPSPDVIIIALTPEIVDLADTIRISGNFHLNFRRALKARAMQWGVPIQLLKRRTVDGDGDVQEVATRAWNFCTAQYYKAQGIPWRPMSLDSATCYMGISFYVAQEVDEQLSVRSSVAQAFDYLGQGLVLRGDPFRWNQEKHGRSPHLSADTAHKLMRDTLNEYVRTTGTTPRRVVVHKTSDFWGSEHSEYNELDGLYAGIKEVFGRCDYDFLTLRQTGVRLFREGSYPPLRGTHFCIDGEHHFLYTMGFIPFLETYPGVYVPEPWQITDHHGSSSHKDLLREVLALTKMNVNNCAFADGQPITLSFSQMVGEIMKHIPAHGTAQAHYRFYM
jgi:hypothetical protein